MDLSIQDMMNCQRALYEAHKDSWDPMAPEFGKDSLLYMIEEVGEVIAVLKKKGSAAIVNDPVVRQAFLEEMADVLMYYHDVLLRYHITAQEISEAFLNKHHIDLNRNYSEEYKELYHG